MSPYHPSSDLWQSFRRAFFLLTFAFLVHSLHGVKGLYLEEKKRKKKLYSHLPLPPQTSSVTCTLAWHLPVGLEFLPGPSRTAFQLVLGARIYLHFPNLPPVLSVECPFCSSHDGAQPWPSSPARKWPAPRPLHWGGSQFSVLGPPTLYWFLPLVGILKNLALYSSILFSLFPHFL